MDVDAHLRESARAGVPVTAIAADYSHGHVIAPHSHAHGQLLYAIEGVMCIDAQGGRWVVPPTRGVWLEAGIAHQVRMSGDVKMRTVFVAADAGAQLPQGSCVLGIPPLLRELILAAIDLPPGDGPASRASYLRGLLLHELRALPVLPLHLPLPSDPRLRAVCERLIAAPDDGRTVDAWAGGAGMSARTLHRLFQQQTGMRFGYWRQQVRLLAALERLARGDKVVDVALDHGYQSQSAFAAMFRRHFGMPPTLFYR